MASLILDNTIVSSVETTNVVSSVKTDVITPLDISNAD